MFIGVVGKPSTGKSTFFKACTLAEIDIANYPFTTIKPNHAIGFVKVNDVAKEFGKVSNPRAGYVQGDFRFLPIDLMDVAGLVPGAHEGLGMGNQFLDDLRQADVLVHVIDASGSVNEKGEPVDAGSYDPINDVIFLEKELDFWYKGILEKGWDKFARQIQQTHAEIEIAIAKQLSGLSVTEEIATECIRKVGLKEKDPTTWSADNLMTLATALRKATKPMIIAANKIDMPTSANNYKRLQERFSDYTIIPCSAECELALREAQKHEILDYIPGEKTFTITKEDIPENQKKGLEFIRTNVLDVYKSTGIQDLLNKAVFETLGYLAIFPGGVSKLEDSKGNVLPDCFLLPPKSTALDFAYKLHTDFGDTFIKGIDVRTKLPVGKDHKLKNLDIMEICSRK